MAGVTAGCSCPPPGHPGGPVKEESVSFGKVDSDVYASLPGEPGAAKFDAADFSEAIKTMDELSK